MAGAGRSPYNPAMPCSGSELVAWTLASATGKPPGAADLFSNPQEAFPGTSQATGGSLQALIGGAPVPSRIQLFQRNSVAKMKWVPRRPLGRAFSSKILGEWRWSHENNIAPNHLGGTWRSNIARNMVQQGAKMWQHSPNITPRWANMAPNIDSRWANIEVQGALLQCPSQAAARFRRKNASQGQWHHLAGHWGAFLASILNGTSQATLLCPFRHGRCWAKQIQSGHAVQRKRCGSLNLSFSYWEAALNRRPFFQPSRSVSWNLAGHWREPSGAHRGCARPRQDSAFSEK